jgi:uncharacterized protein YfdQ (DUF2303 family)
MVETKYLLAENEDATRHQMPLLDAALLQRGALAENIAKRFRCALYRVFSDILG